jgi:hypothetical protein
MRSFRESGDGYIPSGKKKKKKTKKENRKTASVTRHAII